MREATVPCAELLRAVRTFLEEAYPAGPPPERRGWLGLSSEAGMEAVLGQKGVRAIRGVCENGMFVGAGLEIQLGNERYPFMKLVARCASEAPGYILAVDEHDSFSHIPDPSHEAQTLKLLREHNRGLAKRIEARWRTEGLPTQASALQAYLQRRDQAAAERAIS